MALRCLAGDHTRGMSIHCGRQVLGIDEDNARVMVSLAVGSSTTTVSQYAVKLVTKTEFDKFSKYLSKFRLSSSFCHIHIFAVDFKGLKC